MMERSLSIKDMDMPIKKKKIPVTKDTVFQIASVSKTFTALAVMQQVDKGKLKLDQDVQKIPWWITNS